MRVYYWPWEDKDSSFKNAEKHELETIEELWELVDKKKEPINEIIKATGQYVLELSVNEARGEHRYMVLTWIEKE